MKYDLSSLFFSYIQEEENMEFRDQFWAQPTNAKAEQAVRQLSEQFGVNIEDTVNNYACCAEEFGFLTGFQLAAQLLARGAGASTTPKVEVQA